MNVPNEPLYGHILTQLNDALLVLNAQRQISYCNPAAVQLLGLKSEHTAHQPLLQAIPENLLEASGRIELERLLAAPPGGDSTQAELRLETPGGPRWVRVSVQSIDQSLTAEDRACFVLSLHEITHFKENEARLLAVANRRTAETETLRRAGSIVAGSQNSQVTIDRILNELSQVVPYDTASVQLLRQYPNSEKTYLEIVSGRGFDNLDEVVSLRFDVDGDTHSSQVFKAVLASEAGAFDRGWLGVPLIVRGRSIGMIALDSARAGAFNENHVRLTAALANQIAITLENARLFEDLQRLAITDPLTGLYNRRHFFALAKLEFERSIRYGHPLTVLMLDVDHFKEVNDTYGQATGDHVIKIIANICKKQLREVDTIGRYSGEEFAIMLPETPLRHGRLDVFGKPELRPGTGPIGAARRATTNVSGSGAMIAAERLRQEIARTPVETERGTLFVTASLGVAELYSDCPTIEKLLAHADQALAQAKLNGRDRIETAS